MEKQRKILYSIFILIIVISVSILIPISSANAERNDRLWRLEGKLNHLVVIGDSSGVYYERVKNEVAQHLDNKYAVNLLSEQEIIKRFLGRSSYSLTDENNSNGFKKVEKTDSYIWRAGPEDYYLIKEYEDCRIRRISYGGNNNEKLKVKLTKRRFKKQYELRDKKSWSYSEPYGDYYYNPSNYEIIEDYDNYEHTFDLELKCAFTAFSWGSFSSNHPTIYKYNKNTLRAMMELVLYDNNSDMGYREIFEYNRSLNEWRLKRDAYWDVSSRELLLKYFNNVMLYP